MLSLARSTAESVQLAAGSYVFQLRDRFDEMLPSVVVGSPDATWSVPDSPGEIDELVFHPGDEVNINIRLAISQAPLRRIIALTWDDLPGGLRVAAAPTFSAGLTRSDDRHQLDADVSLFVDTTLALRIGDCTPGNLRRSAFVHLDCTDGRPEGAVSRTSVEVRIQGGIVADDDGIGVDVPRVETLVREERRTYFLDKAEGLILQLPRLG